MSRSYAAALTAAVVVGALGGGAVALRTERTPETPAASPASGTPEDAGSPGPPRPLWSSPSTIHDGDRVLDLIDMPDDVDRVRRIPGGYLVTQVTGPGQPAVGVHRVGPDGLAGLVAFALGDIDVDPSGSRVAGLDSQTRTYRIWRVSTGAVAQSVDTPTRPGAEPAGSVGFAPDGLVTEWTYPRRTGTFLMLTTPDGTSTEVAQRPGSWDVSPTRDLLVSTRRESEPSDPVVGALPCLVTGPLVGDGPRHRDCDLRPYGDRATLDPTGTQVLAVPSLTDGFGPGAFSVVDIATGRVRGSVDAPDWTLAGTMLDEDTVLLRGAFTATGNGTVLTRCELGGRCREIERTEAEGRLGVTG